MSETLELLCWGLLIGLIYAPLLMPRVRAVAMVTLTDLFNTRRIGPLRIPTAAGLLLLIAALLAAILLFPALQAPTEPPADRIRQLLSFSTLLLWYLFSAVIVMIASISICRDLDRKLVLLTLTKPVSRAKFMLAKWLSLALLSGAVTLTASILLYARVYSLAPEDPGHEQRTREEADVYERVLIARDRIKHPIDQTMLQNQVSERLRARREQGMDQDLDERQLAVLSDELWIEARAQYWNVNPGRRITRVFTGLAEARLLDRAIIRYRSDTSRLPPQEMLTIHWQIGDGVNTPIFLPGDDGFVNARAREPFEFWFPTRCIAEDGTLSITIGNPNVDDPFTPEQEFAEPFWFDQSDGVVILYPTGTFAMNLFRLSMLIFASMLLLCSLGLLLSAMLSQSIAVLAAIVWLITLLLVGQVSENIDYLSRSLDSADPLTLVMFPLSRMLALVLPDITGNVPVDLLADGLRITPAQAWTGVLTMAGLSGGLILLLAMLALSRRELGESIRD